MTLEHLLIRSHDYAATDFRGDNGEVAIDTVNGTVGPVGREGKATALNDIFKVGQYVSLDLRGGGTDPLRFVVLGVNHDGLEVVSAEGTRGFLPWEVMAGALRQSRQVCVDVLSELENLDAGEQAMVREEIARLAAEIRRHRDAASQLRAALDRLEQVVQNPG